MTILHQSASLFLLKGQVFTSKSCRHFAAALAYFLVFSISLYAQGSKDSAVSKPNIKVLYHFDSGLCPPYEISSNAISFQTNFPNYNVNVLLKNIPDGFIVNLHPAKKSDLIPHLKDQGIWISRDGENYSQVPYDTTGITFLSVKIEKGGDVWIATVLPYGRNQLDKLFVDVIKTPWVKTQIITKDRRSVPVFEFGEDDGKKIIHYIIAGEDGWETGGQWTADYMVRTLCRDQALYKKLTRNAVVRIIPALTIYSNIVGNSHGYTDIEGRYVYGASKWANENPPAEFAIVKEMVEKAIKEKRLGFMLTIHNWLAAPWGKTHGLETIKTAGDNTLSPERQKWAETVMQRFLQDVPNGSWKLPEKIWYPGLARDYTLRQHNVCSFRIEMTTYKAEQDFYKKPVEQMLRNLAEITDWSGVFGK